MNEAIPRTSSTTTSTTMPTPMMIAVHIAATYHYVPGSGGLAVEPTATVLRRLEAFAAYAALRPVARVAVVWDWPLESVEARRRV